MATKRPQRRMPSGPAAPTKSLMEHQDTVSKGDSTARGKVMLTVLVSPERRAAIKAYAAEHEMTMSRLIIEALEERMRRG